MAKRDNNHKTGSKGEWWARGTFENEGYACSAIDPDYGEDFFVFYESDGIIVRRQLLCPIPRQLSCPVSVKK